MSSRKTMLNSRRAVNKLRLKSQAKTAEFSQWRIDMDTKDTKKLEFVEFSN